MANAIHKNIAYTKSNTISTRLFLGLAIFHLALFPVKKSLIPAFPKPKLVSLWFNEVNTILPNPSTIKGVAFGDIILN